MSRQWGVVRAVQMIMAECYQSKRRIGEACEEGNDEGEL